MAARPRIAIAIGVAVAAIGIAFGLTACTRRARPGSTTGRPSVAFTTPGPVAAGFDHAETGWPLAGKHVVECARCHTAQDGQGRRSYVGVDRACTACHANAHAGQLFASRPCEACHSPKTPAPEVIDFDHSSFELGAHRKHACTSCHTAALGTAAPATTCTTCHASDSPHGTRFKKFGSPPACGACHRSGSWRATVFDHARQTGLALTDWHTNLECRQCHRSETPDVFERFKPGTKCMGCHAHARVHADDDHPAGRYTSKQCLLCHRQAEPRRNELLVLAHGPSSSFPLVKRHRDLRCSDCHDQAVARGTDAVSPECASCHVDAHGGARGTTCSTCHAPGTWEVETATPGD